MSTGSRKRGPATRAVVAEIKAERTRQNATRVPKWTQVTFSEATGIPKDTIKSIESFRGPLDVDQLFAMADALGLQPSELVARAEQVHSLAERKPSDARQ